MIKNIIIPILLASTLILCSNFPVTAQNNSGGGIKTRITHQEKVEKGKKSVSIDAEEKYDLRGNTIEEIEYKDGKIDKHMIYEYDSENNRTKETELDASGKPKKIGEYKYEKGLKKEKNIYDANKNLLSKKTYTYTYHDK